MSTQQYLIDAQTRHTVFIQRYGAGQAEEAKKLLDRLREKILARMAQEPTDFQYARLQALLIELNDIASASFLRINDKVLDAATEFMGDEVKFTHALLTRATSDSADFIVPSSEQLAAALSNSTMKMPNNVTMTVRQALEQYGTKKAAEIIQTVQDGIVMGETTPNIARNISNLMQNQQKMQIESLVRTITNHVSSITRDELFKENSELLDGYQWVATLDSRTTLTCAGRDGRVYSIGSNIYPPAHWGCRSTTIPKVKEAFNLGSDISGQRPAIGDDITQESGRTTYGSWLKRQSKEFQNEALGEERAKLFRSGKLSIEQFTDTTGRVYTLDELRNTYPLSFG